MIPRAWVALAVATMAWGMPVAAPFSRTARAQSDGLRVLTFTPAPLELGGSRYILVRGMIQNDGAIGVADVSVGLTLWGDDPQAPLGRGFGQGFLDQLAPGEQSPFTVAVKHCCLQDARRYDFSFQAKERRERPYRALQVRHIASRMTSLGPMRFGELMNTGDRAVFAPSLDVYAAYWADHDLIDIRTANLPVLWNQTGPTGQPLSPGMAYPLALAEPDQAFDRVEYFINGEPFPMGSHPVPLGILTQPPTLDGADALWTARLHNCGLADVELASIILVWRGADGAVLAFPRWDFELTPPLAPGAARWYRLRLVDAPPTLLQEGSLEYIPLAHAEQGRPPSSFVCAPLHARALLPVLSSP